MDTTPRTGNLQIDTDLTGEHDVTEPTGSDRLPAITPQQQIDALVAGIPAGRVLEMREDCTPEEYAAELRAARLHNDPVLARLIAEEEQARTAGTEEYAAAEDTLAAISAQQAPARDRAEAHAAITEAVAYYVGDGDVPADMAAAVLHALETRGLEVVRRPF